jgi:hypothetical protein
MDDTAFVESPGTKISLRALLPPVVLAVSFWFLLFSPWTELTRTIHDRFFWPGMTVATSLLGGITLFVQRRRLRRLFAFEFRFIGWGIAHAIFLYGLSRFGVYLFSELFSWVTPQIESIYATRFQAEPWVIGMLLVLIIAPFEEIFWRGWIMDKLLGIVPPRWALGIAIGLYTAVHLWAFNPMLLLAAFVLGAHWSYMFFKFRSLVPGMVSHAVWDVLIFVLFPIQL